MSASTTTTVANTPAEGAVPAEPRHEEARPRTGASADDWVTAAVVFGILGGCVALWIADLSLVPGMVAALFSGLIGVLFADI
jgi:hypothetical protein